MAIGVPEEWVPVIQKAGYNTVESLKGVKPGKLFRSCSISRRSIAIISANFRIHLSRTLLHGLKNLESKYYMFGLKVHKDF